MIIVSQDKSFIMNFKSIISIGIEEGYESFRIMVSDASNFDKTLARYKSEERAKEVLQEIVIAYNNLKILNMTIEKNKEKILEKIEYDLKKISSIFEMPEE